MSHVDGLTRSRRVDTGGPPSGKPVVLLSGCAVPHEDKGGVVRVVVPDRGYYDAPLLLAGAPPLLELVDAMIVGTALSVDNRFPHVQRTQAPQAEDIGHPAALWRRTGMNGEATYVCPPVRLPRRPSPRNRHYTAWSIEKTAAEPARLTPHLLDNLLCPR